MIRHSLGQKALLVTLATLAVAGFSSAAFAHLGDHSHMAVAEMANHLLSSLDHKFAIMAVVFAAALAAIAVPLMRRKRRERSREKSKI